MVQLQKLAERQEDAADRTKKPRSLRAGAGWPFTSRMRSFSSSSSTSLRTL